MSNLLNKAIVLRLNANWQRIGWSTVKDAVVSMCGMPNGTPPALALDISADDELSAIPTGWDDWIKLPIRKGDLAISTARGAIRCPTVIVDPAYNEMQLSKPKLSNKAILERDGYIDQYTNEKLRPEDANVDHVIPRDIWKKRGIKGNPNCWENMVCCHKDRNFKKGNKLNASAGLALQRRPKAPKAVPISFLISGEHHPHHRFF